MEVLAIVPARSGSKGLKNKNIKKLNNHPLLAYSISAGIQTEKINRTICSTDSEEIAEIAKKYNAEVPFIRPKALAEDTSLDLDVFQHVLDELKNREGYKPDLVINLRPTSPLRNSELLNKAILMIENDKSISSVRSIFETYKTPYKMWTKQSNNLLLPIIESKDLNEAYNLPRQILPKVFSQTATIDIVRASVIESGSMSGSRILGMEIPKKYIIDIDNWEEFNKAEEWLKLYPENYIII